MQRIIDGVLYDTQKSDFIGSKVAGNFTKKKQRSTLYRNYYIAKNGNFFLTRQNDIEMPEDDDILELKRRMDPKIYAKYFPLVIPGDNEKITKKKVDKPKTRLETIE
jgi:hypothetical protein